MMMFSPKFLPKILGYAAAGAIPTRIYHPGVNSQKQYLDT